MEWTGQSRETENHIRPAAPEDWEGVWRLVCALEGEGLSPEIFRGIYMEQMEDGRFHGLVWAPGGRVSAFLNLRMERQLHHAGLVAEIVELVVSQECRSQGVGEELVLAACALARENGCVQIEAACNQVRRDAHRFYERMGMRNRHFKFSMEFSAAGEER